MLPNYIYPGIPSIPSSDLPLTLVTLETWKLIKIIGLDTVAYLHNQLTCDIKNLNKKQYNFAAYCNPFGRMINNMYVFYINDQEIACVTSSSVYKKQILNMKKYILLSHVTILPEHNAIFIGIVGLDAKKYLNTFFKTLPNQLNTVIHYPSVTLLYFNKPTERFLLIITNNTQSSSLLNKLQSSSVQYNNHHQWVALDIEAGYPCISLETSEIFFPQAANMHTLNGISFNKGCYLGQELIARIQHHKMNKKILCHLSGEIDKLNKYDHLPIAGDQIKIKNNSKNRDFAGIVLQACQILNKHIWIQAILNKSILNDGQLYLQNSQLNQTLDLNIKKINK